MRAAFFTALATLVREAASAGSVLVVNLYKCPIELGIFDVRSVQVWHD